MTNTIHQGELSRSFLCAVAEASAQFYWATKAEDLETAAQELRGLGLNPALVCELEAKAARIRTIEALRAEATGVVPTVPIQELHAA